MDTRREPEPVGDPTANEAQEQEPAEDELGPVPEAQVAEEAATHHAIPRVRPRTTAELDGRTVAFIGRAALLKNKEATGRPKDIADAANDALRDYGSDTSVTSSLDDDINGAVVRRRVELESRIA